MTKARLKAFQPGHGYSKEDWDAVDSPPLTDEELARMRPFAEVLPELAANVRRAAGRPPLERPKKAISLRLDQDVIEGFRRTGAGWQSRMNDALRAALRK